MQVIPLWLLLLTQTIHRGNGETCSYDADDQELRLYGNGQHPSLSLSCNLTHFTLSIKNWPAMFQIYDPFMECSSSGERMCVPVLANNQRTALLNSDYSFTEQFSASLNLRNNKCTFFGFLFDDNEGEFYRLPNTTCLPGVSTAGPITVTTPSLTGHETTSDSSPTDDATQNSATLSSVGASTITSAESPFTTTMKMDHESSVTATVREGEAESPNPVQPSTTVASNSFLLTSTEGPAGGMGNGRKMLAMIAIPLIVLTLLPFFSVLAIVLTRHILRRKRMVRKHYDLGPEGSSVDPGPVSELKYDLSLAKWRESCESVYQRLYKAPDSAVNSAESPTPAKDTEKNVVCAVSLYSVNSEMNVGVAPMTITTKVSSMSQEIQLDRLKSDSTWTPYCECSIPTTSPHQSASYMINLSSSSPRSSNYDENDSAAGSPNVVTLIEKPWQLRTDNSSTDVKLDDESFLPHLDEGCGEEDKSGYDLILSEGLNFCRHQNNRTPDEGYRSPVEYGLPVADMLERGRSLDECVCMGGATECMGGVMDCTIGPGERKGVVTLDSGLEETESVMFRFCQELTSTS